MISVIMSVYNETEMELNESINSILDQDVKEIELIIVCDNPNNKSIKDYLLKKSEEDNRIIIHFNSINVGQAESRNIAVKLSNFDLIAVMDADDVSSKNRFSKQIKFLNENNLDFVYSNFKEIDCEDNIIKDHKWELSTTCNQKRLKYIFLNCSDVSLQSTWLLKKDVYRDLLGYRNLVVEDFDFNLRSLLLGHRQGYLSDCLVSKRSRKNGIMQSNRLKIYLTVRLLKKYVKKQDSVPSINYINNNLRVKYNEKDEEIFNEFIISYKEMMSKLSYDNCKKFMTVFLKCRFALIYLFDSFFLRLRQHIHKI